MTDTTHVTAKIVSRLEDLRTSIEGVSPDPDNIKVHPVEQVRELADILDRFGFDQPIVVRSATMTTIKGAGRLMAADLLGWTDAPIVFVDDDELDARRRALADHGSERDGLYDVDLMRGALELATDKGNVKVPGIDPKVLAKLVTDTLRAEKHSWQMVLRCTSEERDELVQRLESMRAKMGEVSHASALLLLARRYLGAH